jgi:hypothetical protein
MTDLRACVIGMLTTHGFLPHSRTQEGPGVVLAPTTEPARLTDTSGSVDIAEYITAPHGWWILPGIAAGAAFWVAVAVCLI